MKKMTRLFLCLSVLVFGLAAGVAVYAQAAAPAATAATPPPSAADAELAATAAKAPAVADLAKGDPGGTLTGTISDVPQADSTKGVTVGDVANQAGQNKIAANFIWTLVTGYLVMFMQAGFAMVESGLCRVKNANHTYMMNFMVYACGLFSYWLIGFAIQKGGSAGNSNLGGLQSLSVEHTTSILGKTWGIFGGTGFLLSGHTYDVGVMVLFLFEMVFMDTALTIVTGAARNVGSSWRSAYLLLSWGAYIPTLRQLGVGWRVAFSIGRQQPIGEGLLRFRWLGCGACGRRDHRAGRNDDHRSSDREVQ